MTVLLPGMTEEDQRVKISSCDTSQQGLLDSWKTKVTGAITSDSSLVFFLTVFHFPEYGQCCRITQ